MANDAIKSTLQALHEFNQDSDRKFWRQYRDAICELSSGKRTLTPENLNRILQSAGKSFSDFEADVSRSELIRAVANAATEAAEIDAKTRPLADEWRAAKAEFDALAKSYREKSERLELQIASIRRPLKAHESLRLQLQSSEQQMPDSIRSVCRGWSNELESLQQSLKHYSRETFEPNNEHGEPAAPERIAAYERDEIKRLAEVRRLETRISILRRAEAIVREIALDSVTSLWDPFADVAACLTMAQQESHAAEAARLEAEAAASIECEQIEESAVTAIEVSE